ncbi:MAG: carbohydrate ABC transporter permease [Candidatus Humimicrobiaceae bacterium]
MKRNQDVRNKKVTRSFSLGKILLTLYIAIFLMIIIFPILWAFSLSFKQPQESTEAYFFIIPKNIKLDNYKLAIEWTNTNQRSVPLTKMYLNSSISTVSSVLATIVIGSIAAYAFSKLKFKGNNTLFYSVLLGMMLPVQAVLIPVFLLNKFMHTYDTLIAIILPYIAFGLPITIFILRGFFLQIPNEFREAAKLDGASEIGIFMKIILPISRPALATCVIFLFMQNWNEFILALTFLIKRNLWTIPVVLSKMTGQYLFPWELYASLIFLAAIPVIVVFAIFQNWFIKGLTAGAIKG